MTWIYVVVTAACMGYSVGTSRRIDGMPRGLIAWGAVVLGFTMVAQAWLLHDRSWVAAAIAAPIWLAVFVLVYRPARAGKLIPYTHRPDED